MKRLEEMPPEITETPAEKAPDAAKPVGKVRLLSLDDMDRRTNAYRRCADLIAHVERDLGGPAGFPMPSSSCSSCCAHHRDDRGPRQPLVIGRTDRSNHVCHAYQQRAQAFRDGWLGPCPEGGRTDGRAVR